MPLFSKEGFRRILDKPELHFRDKYYILSKQNCRSFQNLLNIDIIFEDCLNSFMVNQNYDDIFFMRLALEEAGIAFKEGEIPVGAVLVKSGKVIAKSHNQRETSKDPTGHAEIIALRYGSRENDNWRLTDTTLYVTKEPCSMCVVCMAT